MQTRFTSRPITQNRFRQARSIKLKLTLLAGVCLVASSAHSEEATFENSAGLNPWSIDTSNQIYSGSVHGSHNGNSFTFALGEGEQFLSSGFCGASDDSVQNRNELIFLQGNYRPVNGDGYFHAAHGATQESNDNTIIIKGGNFLPSSSSPSDIIRFAASEGTSNMSGNRIVVEGGNFNTQVMFFAANNLLDEEDISDAGSVLSNNTIQISGGNFSVDADLEVAFSEVGTLNNNKLLIENLNSGRFNMVYAANTNQGNAINNEIVIKDSNLSVQVDLFTASAGSAAPSTLEGNLLYISNSTVNTSSLGAAQNPSGDVLGNRVVISDTTLKSSDENLYVYGGSNLSSVITEDRVIGNVIRLQNVELELDEYKAAYFIAGQILAPEGGVLRNNAIELIGDGNWDDRLAKARLVGAQRFGADSSNISDNSLRLFGWRGEVASIKGFDSIEIADIKWEASGTVLKVDMKPYKETGVINQEKLDLSCTTFAFIDGGFMFEDGVELHLGESMKILEAGGNTELTFNPLYDGEGQTITLNTGVTTEVGGRVVNDTDGKSVILELEDHTEPNRQLAVISNNRNMTVTFLGQAGEIVGDTLSEPPKDYQWGPKTFAILNGADVKYESSGKLTVSGMNFLAGSGTSVRSATGGATA